MGQLIRTADLAKMLRIGLGRAVLHVREQYSLDQRPMILNACLHNLAYDRQIEGDRAAYMLDVIKTTNDFDYYRGQIIEALRQLGDDADEYDVDQVFEFAQLFAETGYQEARQAIYDKFDEKMALGEFAGAGIIIRLDGLSGFIHVTERLGAALRREQTEFQIGEHTYKVDQVLRYELDGKIGEEAAAQAIEKLRAGNPDVAAYLAETDPLVETVADIKTRRERADPKTISYEDMQQLIQSGKQKLGVAEHRWGELANEPDLERAAHDLLAEKNTYRLTRYLRIFGKRTFPLDHTRLIELTHDEDRFLTVAALNALENITHESVRTLALEMIENQRMSGRAVGLLRNNFQQGDWALIESLTERDSADDPEDYHLLAWSIREIVEQQPTSEAIPSLLNIYESGPCAPCRGRTVELLHKLNAVPDWMPVECVYDADFDLREAAVKRFEDHTD